MQEQVYLGEMPPKKKDQPSTEERDALLSWLSTSLAEHDASTLEDKLRYPAYGNYIDHERLFSGEIDSAPWSPARRWLVSPQIFEERVNLDTSVRYSTNDGQRDWSRVQLSTGLNYTF